MTDWAEDAPPEDAALCREALPAGTRFGEMEILRVVAVGGFGIVYRARDHLLDRDVAIKEFMPAQMARRGHGADVVVRRPSYFDVYELGLRSFVNEAKLLARFNHPAMVKVYRFWEANGTGYMVMPYLRGPTLQELRKSMSLAPTEAWLRSIIDPLLDALAMLHDEGIYHRDISPDNVLLPGAAMPVLLDFGAARRLIGDHTQRLTAVLKPGFAPIEQYAEATHLRQGPWTDVYALAAVVAYLLNGKPPPASTARAMDDEMPVLARCHIPGVSTQFLAAIDWALAVRPQDRPAGVAQWRQALDRRIAAPAPVRLQSTPVVGASTYGPTVLLPRVDEVVEARPAPQLPHEARHQPPRPLQPSPRRGWLQAAAALVATLVVGVGLQAALRDPAAESVVRSEPPLAAPQLALTRPTAQVPVPAAMPVVQPASRPVLQAAVLTQAVEASPPREFRRSAAAAKPPQAKRKTTRKTPLATVRLAAGPGPREACSTRAVLARPMCMLKRCGEARFKQHAQCRPMAEDIEARPRTL